MTTTSRTVGRSTVAEVAVGFRTVVRVPSAWTTFSYNGLVYVRDKDGRFVARARLRHETVLTSGPEALKW